MLYGDVTVEEIADIRAREALEIGMERGRELGLEQGLELGRGEGTIENAKYVVSLIDQGLSLDEIKQQLTQTTNN